MNIENYIEQQYRSLSSVLDTQYIELYQSFDHEKLRTIFATLHARITASFESMNTRLPTGDETAYYWADSSRTLMDAIKIACELRDNLQSTNFAFEIDEYYKNIFEKCSDFLVYYRGSTIPEHMDEVTLYYTIPIFVPNTGMIVETPSIKVVYHAYIRDLTERAREDIERLNFDSAVTKCRTLVEEVFCRVIEMKGESPSESGEISALYKQVKTLYNMHQSKEVDVRINMLLSGLEKILTGIAQMRNKDSDAHGVGSKRINIEDHHARLLLNSAMALSDFVLAVAERNKAKEAVVS